MNLLKNITDWFIGDYLKTANTTIDRVRINFVYWSALAFLAFSLIVASPIMAADITLVFVAAIFFVFILMLKYLKNYRLVGKLFSFLLTGILIYTIIFTPEYLSYPTTIISFGILVLYSGFVLNRSWATAIILILVSIILLTTEYEIIQNLYATDKYQIPLLHTLIAIAIIGVIFLLFLTAQKKLIDTLHQKEQEIQEVKTEKATFLTSMGHEIRTPLNAVINLTNLLLQENPRNSQIENLHNLKFAGDHLLLLINDIVDYGKIVAGDVTIETTDFSLSQLLNGIQHATLPKTKEKGLFFEINEDKKLPNYIKGDAIKLAQILYHLVENAVKFTIKGGIKINIKVEKETHDTVQIRFEVQDSGVGIPSHKIAALLRQSTPMTTNELELVKDISFGLTIARSLIHFQKGKLQINSQVGIGTTFCFSLTYQKGHQPNEKSNEAIRIFDTQTSQSLEGFRVLLVEDNKINRLVAQKFLNKWGIEVDLAEDGSVAIEKVEHKHYHLILMDLQMPKMDGYKATEIIRAMKGPKSQVPIVALTAFAMPEVKQKVFEIGMNDYVTKPFKPKALYEMVKKYGVVKPIAV